MERIVLPEPARTVWKSCREQIRALFCNDHERAAYVIGGDVLLAARWGHRRASEIEVVTTNLEKTRELILSDGWRQTEELKNAHAQRVSYTHFRIHTARGSMSIAIREPEPRGLERTAVVDAHEETVLSNSQVMNGILARTMEFSGTNAFDIIMAATADPKGLEDALMDSAPRQIRMLKRTCIAMNEFLTVDAGRRLLEPTAGIRIDDIGEQAAEILEQVARKAEVRIAREN